jgi:hypothetical protein
VLPAYAKGVQQLPVYVYGGVGGGGHMTSPNVKATGGGAVVSGRHIYMLPRSLLFPP